MRLTKIDKAVRLLNDSFSETLRLKFAEKFSGLVVESHWDIFSMQLVTTLKNGEDFTQEQLHWVSSFSEGYEAAQRVVQGIEGKLS